MDITPIAYIIVKLAPLLGSMIAGPGGIILCGWISSVFSSEINQSDMVGVGIKMIALLAHINLFWNASTIYY
ncbi:MAG: hypothetical protein K0S27_1387 [Gammaproteobacteria bacterium]|nr:hypothetical protein [Gammaproteobacteria bacterium]